MGIVRAPSGFRMGREALRGLLSVPEVQNDQLPRLLSSTLNGILPRDEDAPTLREEQKARTERSKWPLYYAVAVGMSTLPLLLKLLFGPLGIGKDAPFLLLIPAVLVSAWYGGLGPGLVATVLTALGADLFFLPPYGAIAKTPDAAVAVVVYATEGALVSWLIVAFQTAHRDRARLGATEQLARMELEVANRIRTWVQTSPIPIVSFECTGKVSDWNAAAERLFGWSEGEVTGRPPPYVPDDRWAEEQGLFERAMRGEPVAEVEARRRTKDGSWRDLRVSMSPIWDTAGKTCGVTAVLVDVTERKQMEKQLQYQAFHDVLTGLANRKLLYDRLQQALVGAGRNKTSVALLLMDLDGFKEVNDTFGHRSGDLLLQGVATRLRDVLRESDTVARLGGDEFAAILLNTAGSGAIRVADKILSALADPFEVAQRELVVGGSIGIALFPQDGEDVDTLLQHADVAMYAAKRAQCGHKMYSALH